MKKYEAPITEIVEIEAADVITRSYIATDDKKRYPATGNAQ